jgi:hypothetical protein
MKIQFPTYFHTISIQRFLVIWECVASQTLQGFTPDRTYLQNVLTVKLDSKRFVAFI